MVQINFALKEINCKLVYYGPGRSGKTTNLEQVHQKAPEDSKGDLVSINTETDRTLYFDFLPLNLGKVAGMTTKFSLYTVPGQVYYNATRKLVLQGVDGVVFVADSSPHMMEENIESIENMMENLRENGIDPLVIPVVLQYNKRDVDGAMDLALMNEKLNFGNWRTIEACAYKGEGVFPTLKTLAGLVISKLNEQEGYGTSAAKPAAPPPPPAAKPVAPPPAAAVEVAPKPVVEQPKPVAPPPPPPAPAPAPAAPVAEPKAPAPAKEDSKADLIAARLAKMRAEKSNMQAPTASQQPTEKTSSVTEPPRKLKQKGFMGFIKRLFGKG